MGATILSDGRVAMILDPMGTAEVANLSFSEIENDSSTEQDDIGSLGTGQELLLFKNGTEEFFGVNIQSISRINKVEKSSIERTGGKEFINYEGSSLRIIRLHDFLPVTTPTKGDKDVIFVLIPKFVSHPVGIVATDVMDIIQNKSKLEKDVLTESGILATSIINEKMALFIDIFNLHKSAEPELYPDTFSEKRSGLKVIVSGDQDYYQLLNMRHLEGAGCDVTECQTGHETIQLLEKGEKFDILLTDMSLPDMDAVDLIREIKDTEETGDLPVLALVSVLSGQQISRIERSGADAYCFKTDREEVFESIISFTQDRRPAS